MHLICKLSFDDILKLMHESCAFMHACVRLAFANLSNPPHKASLTLLD